MRPSQERPVDYRQKNWLEWLVIAKFVVNNKTYSATKVSLFMANYKRELRMGADIRRQMQRRQWSLEKE